jgi:RNA polymerase sigma-70 factor (ECF subfamily)
LRELYERYGASVFGRCQYLLRDDALAEDAMQDVFAKALTHLDAFRAEASPLTWLMKIATNHCVNLSKSRSAPWKRLFAVKEQAEPLAHGGPQLVEARDFIHKALARFDAETQAAAIHYWIDEMTMEEVALALGRSVPTIRKRLLAFAEATGKELR